MSVGYIILASDSGTGSPYESLACRVVSYSGYGGGDVFETLDAASEIVRELEHHGKTIAHFARVYSIHRVGLAGTAEPALTEEGGAVPQGSLADEPTGVPSRLLPESPSSVSAGTSEPPAKPEPGEAT